MTVFDTTWPIYSESGSCHSVTLWEIEIFKMATTNVKQIKIILTSLCSMAYYLWKSKMAAKMATKDIENSEMD